MTSGAGSEYVFFGIKHAVELRLLNLPQLDLFEDIDPMFEGDANVESIGRCNILEASKHV